MWSFQTNGDLSSVETVRIEAIEIDPDMRDVEFHIKPTVGMVVRDNAIDIRWQLQSDGTKRQIDHPRVGAAHAMTVQPWFGNLGLIAAICAVFLAFMIVCLLRLRTLHRL
jgi:hypothetical protein